MNKELLILILPPTGWILWWMGGRGILGTKTWRRDVLPIIFSIVAILSGAIWWRVVLGGASMAIIHRLGYGNMLPGWRQLLTMSLLGFPLILFGAAWYWWIIISGWFMVSTWLSREEHGESLDLD